MLRRRGFRFSETMSGTYALIDQPGDHRRFSFTVEARAESAARHLRDGRATLRGTLEADGFADGVPAEGTITILPLTRRTIGYELEFTGNDGQPYRFSGQKQLRLTALARSFTELPGTILDATGAPVATCLTRFDLRADLFQFLTSWRFA
jgi:hypothetical protein